jgi:hypothetical protein
MDHPMRRRISLVVLASLSALPLSANAGVPAAAGSLALNVLLFIPVVLIEVWRIRKTVPVTRGRALAASAVANLASILAGVVFVVLTPSLFWTEDMFGLMTLIAFIPLAAITLVIDVPIYQLWFRAQPRAVVRRAVLRAHGWSYGLLVLWVLVFVTCGALLGLPRPGRRQRRVRTSELVMPTLDYQTTVDGSSRRNSWASISAGSASSSRAAWWPE